MGFWKVVFMIGALLTGGGGVLFLVALFGLAGNDDGSWSFAMFSIVVTLVGAMLALLGGWRSGYIGASRVERRR